MRSKNGFSLTEVIVATLLLATVTAAVYTTLLSSKTLTMRSNLRNKGYAAAESVFGTMKGFYLNQVEWNDTNSPINPGCSTLYSQSGGWTVWMNLTDSNPFLNLSGLYMSSDLFNVHNGAFRVRVTDGTSSPTNWRACTVQVRWEVL